LNLGLLAGGWERSEKDDRSHREDTKRKSCKKPIPDITVFVIRHERREKGAENPKQQKICRHLMSWGGRT
jgi:hypothetical protein